MTLSQTILSFRVNSGPFLIKIGGINSPEDLETFPPKRFALKVRGCLQNHMDRIIWTTESDLATVSIPQEGHSHRPP